VENLLFMDLHVQPSIPTRKDHPMADKRPTIAKAGPCNDCPWRKDAPKEHWHPDHFHEIAESCRNDGINTMLCHKSKAEGCTTDFVCAGWVAAQGTESIGVRLLILQGKVDPSKDYSGGHKLYTFDQMLKANKIKVVRRGPYDHNIEMIKAMMRQQRQQKNNE